MTRYAGSRDYVGNLQSPWRTPTLLLRVLCTEHTHRIRNERVGVCNERFGVLFFSGSLDRCGVPTETEGSLRNTETRRTPSYNLSIIFLWQPYSYLHISPIYVYFTSVRYSYIFAYIAHLCILYRRKIQLFAHIMVHLCILYRRKIQLNICTYCPSM